MIMVHKNEETGLQFVKPTNGQMHQFTEFLEAVIVRQLNWSQTSGRMSPKEHNKSHSNFI